MEKNKIYCGDALATLKTFGDGIVDCCVTSPPYFGLRDYGTATWSGGDVSRNHFRDNKNDNPDFVIQTRGDTGNGTGDAIYKNECGKCGAVREDGQIGLEETPEEYVEKLVAVFREVFRVLKPTGTLWLNLGDSYSGSGRGLDADGTWNAGDGTSKQGTNRNNKSQRKVNADSFSKKRMDAGAIGNKWVKPPTGYKAKDLIGIPWMVAFALRNTGWYLRQDIIWNKPNPMPESVTDRCTKSHEYIFLLSKSPRYYYDAEAIKTKVADATVQRMLQQIDDQKGSDRVPGKTNGNMKAVGPGRVPRKGVDVNGGNQASDVGIPAMAINGNGVNGRSGYFDGEGNLIGGGRANKKSVWTVTTKPFKEAHFATFPEKLIEDCIKAGSSEHGCCGDCGAPWERIVQKRGGSIGHGSWTKHDGNAIKMGMMSGNTTNAKQLMRSKDDPYTVQTIGWQPTCECNGMFVTHVLPAGDPLYDPDDDNEYVLYESSILLSEHPIVPAIVLDPFSGAGTTALVARKLGRDFVGIELSSEYVTMSERRLQKELGLFHHDNNQGL